MKNFIQLLLFLCLIIFVFPNQIYGQTSNNRPASPCKNLSTDDCSELEQTGNTGAPIALDSPSIGSPMSAASQKSNACGTANNLICPYNSNNGQRGCMFDLTATNMISISCFDVNLYAGTTANYEIYYRAGSHVGNETNSAAWISLGNATGVTSAGNNLPTPIPITFNVTIPAGQTYAFYITNDFGGGTSYTDGTAVGNFLASDANLTVFEGVGKAYPFGLTFNVRNFNGTIFYNLGNGLNLEMMTLDARISSGNVLLSWIIPQNVKASQLELQQSRNGIDFESISNYDSPDNQDHFLHLTSDPKTFYRLQAMDENGVEYFSNIAQVKNENQSNKLKVYPNPFSQKIEANLFLEKACFAQVSLRDLNGKLLWEEKKSLRKGLNHLSYDGSNLKPGMYILTTLANGKRTNTRLTK